MKVYQRDGAKFYAIGFLLLFAIFFIMAFVSMDKSSLESTSQNSANQLVHRASTNKEDQRSRQTTEESNNMLNPLYWGMGITAIFMIVLGYISNHRPPILEMDEIFRTDQSNFIFLS